LIADAEILESGTEDGEGERRVERVVVVKKSILD
jgi:hypothetical protein